MGFTDEKVTEYFESFYRPVSEELMELRLQNENDRVPLILRETEGFLRLMLDIIRPSRILEIGTACGYSALFFASILPDARITTIERDGACCRSTRENFGRISGGDRITLLEGEADEILEGQVDRVCTDGRYDFIFIDAGKSHYREFFDRAELLAAPGAVAVCDNVLMHGWTVSDDYKGAYRHRTNVKYMRRFIEYINSRDDLKISLLSSGDGLAVIRFNDDRDR